MSCDAPSTKGLGDSPLCCVPPLSSAGPDGSGRAAGLVAVNKAFQLSSPVKQLYKVRVILSHTQLPLHLPVLICSRPSGSLFGTFVAEACGRWEVPHARPDSNRRAGWLPPQALQSTLLLSSEPMSTRVHWKRSSFGTLILMSMQLVTPTNIS